MLFNLSIRALVNVIIPPSSEAIVPFLGVNSGYDLATSEASFDFFTGGLSPNLVTEGIKKSASTFSAVSLTMPKVKASAICLLGIRSATE